MAPPDAAPRPGRLARRLSALRGALRGHRRAGADRLHGPHRAPSRGPAGRPSLVAARRQPPRGRRDLPSRGRGAGLPSACRDVHRDSGRDRRADGPDRPFARRALPRHRALPLRRRRSPSRRSATTPRSSAMSTSRTATPASCAASPSVARTCPRRSTGASSARSGPARPASSQRSRPSPRSATRAGWSSSRTSSSATRTRASPWSPDSGRTGSSCRGWGSDAIRGPMRAQARWRATSSSMARRIERAESSARSSHAKTQVVRMPSKSISRSPAKRASKSTSP